MMNFEALRPLINFILGAIAIETTVIVYRLYFHPLAKFPGPKILAVSQWYEFFVDVFVGHGHTFYSRVDSWHEKYGPIIRISPSELHVKDPHWLRVLFTGPGQERNKHESLAHIVGNSYGTFGTVPHHLHRQRRSAVGPFFSKRSVTAIEPRIRRHTECLCDKLWKSSEEDKVVNARVTFLAWSTDALTSYVFDKPTGLLQNDQAAQDWWRMFEAMRKLYAFLRQALWVIPIALELPLGFVQTVVPVLAPLLKVYKDMRVLAKEVYHSHDWRSAPRQTKSNHYATEHPNIFRALLSSNLPDEEKEPNRIAQEGFETLTAGSATASRIMVFAAYHVMANPHVLERLREELKVAIPDPHEIPDVKILEALPYLKAVVKEALRIANIVTFRTPLVAPEDTLHYGDLEIPAGTCVSMRPPSALIDPNIFPEPNRFLPERWLEGDEEQLVRQDRFFLPFGLGSRMCLGMNFAYAELYTAVSAIFRRFEMELYDTVRERDVDHSRFWFIGEPSKGSEGVRFKVTGCVNDYQR